MPGRRRHPVRRVRRPATRPSRQTLIGVRRPLRDRPRSSARRSPPTTTRARRARAGPAEPCPRRLGRHQRGALRQRQHEDEVEEQLERRDALGLPENRGETRPAGGLGVHPSIVAVRTGGAPSAARLPRPSASAAPDSTAKMTSSSATPRPTSSSRCTEPPSAIRPLRFRFPYVPTLLRLCGLGRATRFAQASRPGPIRGGHVDGRPDENHESPPAPDRRTLVAGDGTAPGSSESVRNDRGHFYTRSLARSSARAASVLPSSSPIPRKTRSAFVNCTSSYWTTWM